MQLANIYDRNLWVRDLQASEDSSQYGEIILGIISVILSD